MPQSSNNLLRVLPQYQPAFRELGLDAEQIFAHPLIKPWRILDDRENCVLDTSLNNGEAIRWHVKRYGPHSGRTPAEDEDRGYRALVEGRIPTAVLVAYGIMPDRRSFVIYEDLAGYHPADKLIEGGEAFEKLLIPTADLTAKLHRSNLHHRDLYLCHFFAKVENGKVDLKMIDPARVRKLPGFFTRGRWIVKDLAQFWYSSTKLPITDDQRNRWLKRYAEQNGRPSVVPLQKKVERKVAWIGEHDKKLRKSQPNRNISIPRAL